MLSGTFSLSNTVIEAGFGTTLYTGNGSTQSINAGVDLATQWGDSANETYGGLVWTKSRSDAANHYLHDTVRGINKLLRSNLTDAEYTASSQLVTSFNYDGFSIGNDGGINYSSYNYASWVFQTTHRISGTTNHGKNYTCHYNPITGFTIVKYEGSGIAGHEIPHHLGRPVGFFVSKSLTTATNWYGYYDDDTYLVLNDTYSIGSHTNGNNREDDVIRVATTGDYNASGATSILYGWANSYYDDAGELNGNYEVGIYQGTGASGNKITTRGKPAWIMIKRLDSVGGNWLIYDNQRRAYLDARIVANTSATEYYNYDVPPSYNCTFENKSFTVNNGAEINASGGQYLYMCVYDNDNASGKSKYPKASETSNISVTNGVVAYSDGVGSNGANSSIENLGSTTFTGITWDI